MSIKICRDVIDYPLNCRLLRIGNGINSEKHTHRTHSGNVEWRVSGYFATSADPKSRIVDSLLEILDATDEDLDRTSRCPKSNKEDALKTRLVYAVIAR